MHRQAGRLSGDYPFKGDNLDKLAEAIKKGDLEFNIDAWLMVSFRAKNLVRKLLCIDPRNRPTAQQILQDPWFVEMDREMSYCNCFINLEVVVKKIKKHTMKKKVKRAISGIKLVTQIQQLNRLDSNASSKGITTFIRIFK